MPVKRRLLFPLVTRACQGVIFTSVDLVKQLMEKTRTGAGLRVVVDVIDKVYQTGRRVAEQVKKSLNLLRDALLHKWNYCILPRPSQK